jgi:hypothetical protein
MIDTLVHAMTLFLPLSPATVTVTAAAAAAAAAALPSVDTYFMLDCSGARDLGALYSSSHADSAGISTDISTGTSWDSYSAGLQLPALSPQQQQQETLQQQHAVWLAQQQHSSHLIRPQQPGDRPQALPGLQHQQREDQQQQQQEQRQWQQQRSGQQGVQQHSGTVSLQGQQQ